MSGIPGGASPAAATAAVLALLGGPATPTDAHAQAPAEGTPVYRVYVANESSDLVSRVAFTPGRGAVVEKNVAVGIMPGDNDGAHGVTVSPDGRYWYVSIAHGTPFGYVWKFHAGPDTLVARTRLGRFPATMGLTPDGQFLLAANFNLHGDMEPSSISIVYAPDMLEIAKIRTCLMPHGSRLDAAGTKHYSVCMHSEQLVEIDVESFQPSARFHVAPGREGLLGRDRVTDAEAEHVQHADRAAAPCSPTWVEPATGERANRFVYVACNKNREVIEVDTQQWRVSRRFATGAGPYNLEAVAGGRLLVATLKGEQAVAVFDLEAGASLGRVPTSRPVTHGVASSPDGRWAFVTNESVGSVRGTLDVIDLHALKVVATLELEHQPGGIDFWSAPPAR